MEQKRHKVLRNLVSKKLNLILIFAHFSVFCCYSHRYNKIHLFTFTLDF